ncbi:hypothetical protein M427DRAFT_71570 [Gonapodya prolifera JEL478]|uniref:UBP-type domain-containing protein n=1 Tax=Gonapodya prolifera (strain JEL478) TaxID=1344416 RepID=A0A139A9N4_GONPJ|nr:hypothetical protein M427DRAFT_71570 [Gonapodya prolifera JEL478]|eukprot:KXS13175.1 hypothetical protein M427DRAFT_71570 [Gonapodya prolifera JEL478]
MLLSDFPDELLIHLFTSTLPVADITRIALTSRRFHALFADENSYAWALVCKRHGRYPWKTSALSYRCLALAPFEGTCTHLAPLLGPETVESLKINLARLYAGLGAAPLADSFHCSDGTCDWSWPDIWLCLAPECGFVGCGRHKGRHALRHARDVRHPTTMKLASWELWCYACNPRRPAKNGVEHFWTLTPDTPLRNLPKGKWLGNPQGDTIENNAVDHLLDRCATTVTPALLPPRHLNSRRALERPMSELYPEDEFYLVSPRWYVEWTRFVIGDAMDPPGGVQVNGLYRRRQFERPEAERDEWELDERATEWDVWFLPARSIPYIFSTYPPADPLRPPICERDVPHTSGFAWLRSMIANVKQQARAEEEMDELQAGEEEEEDEGVADGQHGGQEWSEDGSDTDTDEDTDDA